MIPYLIELGLTMLVLFLAGCFIGAMAGRALARKAPTAPK